MAQEIRVAGEIEVTKGFFHMQHKMSVLADLSGAGHGGVPGTIDVSENEVQIDTSELGIFTGWLWLQSIEPTDGSGQSIWFGGDDGAGNIVRIGLIGPGEFALFRNYPNEPILVRCNVGETARMYASVFSF